MFERDDGGGDGVFGCGTTRADSTEKLCDEPCSLTLHYLRNGGRSARSDFLQAMLNTFSRAPSGWAFNRKFSDRFLSVSIVPALQQASGVHIQGAGRMSYPAVRRRPLTVEQFQQMITRGILTKDDRVELLNGEILAISPINPSHAGIVKRLNHLFNNLIPDDVIIAVQDPVQLDDTSQPQPDICLLKATADFLSVETPATGRHLVGDRSRRDFSAD